MQHILDRVASVTPLDAAAMELARSRQQQLTKPAGSLGRLEDYRHSNGRYYQTTAAKRKTKQQSSLWQEIMVSQKRG